MVDRPNIVICQCDQLRAFNLGCYGDPVVKTPNIDTLAGLGVRVETAVTNNPVCTPARSSLISGQYSRTCTGMLGNVHKDPPNPERVRLLKPTLPEILRKHGYQTALIGKWHIDPRPQLVGYDTALYPQVAHRYYGQTVYNECLQSWVVDQFLEDYFADRVKLFLRESTTQPFFLHYAISLPHQPIGKGHVPDRYTEKYLYDDIILRPNAYQSGKPSYDPFWFNVYTSADYYWRYLRREAQDPADMVSDDFDLVDLTRLYFGAITCVDDLVGRLLSNLRDCGLLDNTIVIFVSDHGDNLGSHGLFNKNSLIEESIRIPLIVYDPRNKQPIEVRDHIINIIDILPTVLGLVDVDIPDYIQGRSYANLLRQQAYDAQDEGAFIETGPMIGVRTNRYLYGMQYNEVTRSVVDGESWLYDLLYDPYQEVNLAGSQSIVSVEQRLRNVLLSWDRETDWLDAPKHIPYF
jgi:choline-sulfatase